MKRRPIFAMVSLLLVGIPVGVATAQNPLVYVSRLTGPTSGDTNIYEITPSGAQLVGALDHGGGRVAVDAQQNVYVIQADYSEVGSAPVFMYPLGGTQGTLVFTLEDLVAWAMTVTADGTVYIVGRNHNRTTFSVVKFAPPAYSGEVLVSGREQNLGVPRGISLDSSGNIFAGWFGSQNVSVPIDPCHYGCILELPVGQSEWQLRLEFAATEIAAGPFVTTDGSLIFRAGDGAPVRFNYIETVPAGEDYPSQVIQLPPALLLGYLQAFSAGGTKLWYAPGPYAPPGLNVVGVDYPSGTVANIFPVNGPPAFFYIMDIAVSPAYFP